MSFTPVSGTPPQYSTLNNELATDYWIKFYAANTANGINCATDATGGTLLAKVKLSTSGYPISDPLDNDTVFIPHIDQDYRIVLYTSEADADADNTANAAFNINPLSAGAAVTQPSSSVTLRDTTLQASDDYDRSPLFVDGTDFTAGAPPHVITTPAGWNPGAASTRFWKRSADGTIASAIISAQTSTTFTVNESLLSTDTIFIGDDENRNIHDGDPLDIRTRLGAPSNAEALLVANSLQEIEDAGAAAQSTAVGNLGLRPVPVSGYTRADHIFIRNDNGNAEVFSTATAETTVGKTGSGATEILASLDNLPTETTHILVRAFCNLNATTIITTPRSLLWVYRNGGSAYDFDFFATDAPDTGKSYQSTQDIWVNIDDSSTMIFKFQHGITGGTGTVSVRFTLIGYAR
jgi:hypothetical protein